EDYDKVFLGKILDRFQALPTHEKPEWILRFGKLLDMTHVLKRLEEPIDQLCKGTKRFQKQIQGTCKINQARTKRGRPRKDKDSKEESKKKKLNNKQKNGKRKKSDTGKSLSESTEGSSSDDEELTDRENQIGIATVAATLTALSTSTAPDVLETSSNTDVWSNFNEKYLRTINNEISYDKLLRITSTPTDVDNVPPAWGSFGRRLSKARHTYLKADASDFPSALTWSYLKSPIFLVFLEGQDHCNAFNCHEGIYPGQKS
ncbi:hypothetical protein PSHT_16304, partial [Puccinia striiformis]